ncbi:type VI secretion system baseplate subunit TssF [Thetidibacter halocola]|uniref:Type VI secretion system baseplate subunit TssF n=1 Tax=Thetidibacter halocola TaxID=2827239 RepID=A0A8J7W9U6_9RHOB|nr:type VI secretion system baseplate subunit TssF [Thetidibacter halocola]
MKKAFRDAYNRELALLRERAAEFARDYPGLADRLGGLLEENLDPTVAGLLEGSAFLAARVQLKLEEEFRGFTREMLDQLLPGLMEPVPPAMMVVARPPHADADLVNGVHFKRGDLIEAVYRVEEKRVPVRFSLCAPLSLWPLALTELRYLTTKGQIGVYRPEVLDKARAGLMLELARVGLTGEADDSAPLTDLRADALTFHFAGPMEEAVPLYEQIHARRLRVTLRWDGGQGMVHQTLPPDAIEAVGFGPREGLCPQDAIRTDLDTEDEALLPRDDRLFRGFALLREAFIYPRRLLGFRIKGLREIWPRLRAARVQIVVEFDALDHRLQSQLEASDIVLHAAPAVNLFIEDASPKRLDRASYEFNITPLSSPLTHYEFHRVTDIWAHYQGAQTRRRVNPLYGLPEGAENPRHALYFTQRRKPRRRTESEIRQGVSREQYLGTETFVSLYEPPGSGTVQRLEARGWCSNRHLADPRSKVIRQGRDDFYFCDQREIALACFDGPTQPRDSLADLESGAPHRTRAGDIYWRLLSHLSLNAYGVTGRPGAAPAAALREMLMLFADLSDSVTETQIAGIQDMTTEPETGSIPHPEGYLTARGLRITVTFDEEAFDGSGIMLLGTVLDRFFADYAAVNSFTRTVIRSLQRGEVHAFPRRLGNGRVL